MTSWDYLTIYLKLTKMIKLGCTNMSMTHLTCLVNHSVLLIIIFFSSFYWLQFFDLRKWLLKTDAASLAAEWASKSIRKFQGCFIVPIKIETGSIQQKNIFSQIAFWTMILADFGRFWKKFLYEHILLICLPFEKWQFKFSCGTRVTLIPKKILRFGSCFIKPCNLTFY